AVLSELNATAKTLRDMVDFLAKDKKDQAEALRTIIALNHPAFRRFADITKTPYRVFFTNRAEFVAWINARNWKLVDREGWDYDSLEEWASTRKNDLRYIKITIELFDKEARLKPFSETEWKDEWITVKEFEPLFEDKGDKQERN